MRGERRHLEGCRTRRAVPCPRQPEARSDVPPRWRRAPVGRPALRRRCFDTCPRGSARADPHRRGGKELAAVTVSAGPADGWPEAFAPPFFFFHAAPLDMPISVPYLF